MISKGSPKKEKKVPQKRKKNDAKSTIILIVVLMAAVTVGVNLMQTLKTKLPQVSVIVAAENIPADTVITESMLKNDARYTDDLMKLDVANNIATSATDIVGKRTCAPIYVGEPINKHRVIENTSAMKENAGKLREVSIAYSADDLGLTIRKGDFVDLWKVPTAEGISNGYLPERVLENIEVISLSTDDGFDITKYNPTELTADTYLAPGFYSVFLNEAQLQQFYSVDTKNYSIKVAAHTDNSAYADRVNSQDSLQNGTAVQEPAPNQTQQSDPEGEPVGQAEGE